jgi:hypothetical protein
MTAQNRGLTGAQISMLEMLAGCPDGCSEAVLKANGFTIGSLGKLIRAGLATATPGIVEAGGRTLGVVRLAITEKGRTMIARDKEGGERVAGEPILKGRHHSPAQR